MHIVLCLFLMLFSRTAISSSRIAVLISVKNPIHTPIFKSKNWSLSKDLRKYFEKKMGETEFEVVFFENANQETLHSELINPKNIALFWISHATSFEGNESGLTFEDMIVDFDGGNVRDIFQKIHPNLKYLSVLGCKAGPILKKIKQDGFFVNNPDLLIYAKDSTISAKKEIKKSIKDFKQKMNDKTHMRSACLQSKGIPLEIKRFLPSRLSSDGVETSVRVMNRGVFLGLFPKAKPGEVQSLTVYLASEKIKSLSDLKIVLDTGSTKSSKNIILGSFEISSSHFNGAWEAFKTPKGEVIGLSRHIYRYVGSVENILPLESYENFLCEN